MSLIDADIAYLFFNKYRERVRPLRRTLRGQVWQVYQIRLSKKQAGWLYGRSQQVNENGMPIGWLVEPEGSRWVLVRRDDPSRASIRRLDVWVPEEGSE